jgi:dinuclear metal center YbgI/SA1388 family protein
MIRVGDIINLLEDVAPLRWQEDFDNAGMQVGRSDMEANAALLCLDVTEEVIDEAVYKGCNLIISHHPLLFHPLKSLTDRTYIERCVAKACKQDICIYSAHTNMDNAPGGVNYKLANMIGLSDVRILSPDNNKEGAGSGTIGTLQTAESAVDFLHRIKQIFRLDNLRHSAVPNKHLKTVAICGGSGAFLWQEAVRAGADVFITGEARYNDFYDVEDKILLAVIGHYESEVCTMELFHTIVSEKFPTFALYFSNTNSNPVKYL